MKKKIMAMLLVGTLAMATFVGCGSKSKQTTEGRKD